MRKKRKGVFLQKGKGPKGSSHFLKENAKDNQFIQCFA